MSEAQLVGWIFIGVGVATLAVGMWLFMRRRRFVRTAVTTKGTVTAILQKSGSEGGVVYSRVVQFATADGRQVVFEESSAYSRVKQKVGDPIPVRYQADEPEKALIGTFLGTWGFPLLFMVIGPAFLIAGVLTLILGGGSDPAPRPASPSFSVPVTTLPVLPSTTTPPTPGGTIVSARNPSGSGTATATCESVVNRRGGAVREYTLLLDGETTVVLTLDPFTGAGTYQAGRQLRVGGTFFEGATEPFTGVLVVDATGRGGTINVSSGAYGVSGTIDCTEQLAGG